MTKILVTPEWLMEMAYQIKAYREEYNEINKKISNFVSALPEELYRDEGIRKWRYRFDEMRPSIEKYSELLEDFARKIDDYPSVRSINGQVVIKNLKKGIETHHNEHLQGFPDSEELDELRGICAILLPQIRNEFIDPEHNSVLAAILLLICVAGGLITITSNGYKCNNGFIDSFGNMYESQTPVLDNLKYMYKEHIRNWYFIETALGMFRCCADSIGAEKIIELYKLTKREVLYPGSRDQLQELSWVIEQLSKPLDLVVEI